MVSYVQVVSCLCCEMFTICLYIVSRLSPELYLKRPALHGNYWRLDNILERKAVCIVLQTCIVASFTSDNKFVAFCAGAVNVVVSLSIKHTKWLNLSSGLLHANPTMPFLNQMTPMISEWQLMWGLLHLRNVWNMRWRAADQEVDQKGRRERLCKKIAKHAI